MDWLKYRYGSYNFWFKTYLCLMAYARLEKAIWE